MKVWLFSAISNWLFFMLNTKMDRSSCIETYFENSSWAVQRSPSLSHQILHYTYNKFILCTKGLSWPWNVSSLVELYTLLSFTKWEDVAQVLKPLLKIKQVKWIQLPLLTSISWNSWATTRLSDYMFSCTNTSSYKALL